MGLYENLPYVNTHELNLAWILDQVKTLTEEWAATKTEFGDLKTEWASYKEYIDNYFANLDVSQEISDKLDRMARDGSLDALILPYFNAYKAEINTIVSGQNTRMDALSARMDTFSRLPDGSTTGDAELMDIRVGYDGKTWPSAGDAVRGQIDEVMDVIKTIAIIDIVNLIDKDVVTLNKIMTSTGATKDSVGNFYTDYIPVRPSTTYIMPYQSSVGVSNMIVFNSAKTRIGSFDGVRDGDYVKYTTSAVSSIAYGVVNGSIVNLDNVMLIEGTSYPNVYVPFDTSILVHTMPLSETQESQVDEKIEKTIISDESPNMFDKFSTGIQSGYYSNGFNPNANYRASHLIPVEKNVVYKYKHSSALGTNYQVAYFNENGVYAGYVVGTYSDGYVTFSSSNDMYVRLNIGRASQIYDFMLCEANEYPDIYMPYGRYLKDIVYPNSNFAYTNLIGKKIVFDGDSICRGAEDAIPGEAYPARIGNSAKMEWYNLGVSGATIAVVPGVSHNLCTYIDTIIAKYPEIDYLILEGGTNDADRLGVAGLGTLSDNYDGSYDTATFYGALETLFYKAISSYGKDKIGFIVAMKMGTSNSLLDRRRLFFDAAINACEKWGVPYIDLWKGCTINPLLNIYYDPTKTAEENKQLGKYYADGQHPTTYGYDYLSPIIQEWISTL